jgi:hypothetical protein
VVALGLEAPTAYVCNRHWLALEFSVAPMMGLVLTMHRLPAKVAQFLQTWITPIDSAVSAYFLLFPDRWNPAG